MCHQGHCRPKLCTKVLHKTASQLIWPSDTISNPTDERRPFASAVHRCSVGQVMRSKGGGQCVREHRVVCTESSGPFAPFWADPGQVPSGVGGVATSSALPDCFPGMFLWSFSRDCFPGCANSVMNVVPPTFLPVSSKVASTIRTAKLLTSSATLRPAGAQGNCAKTQSYRTGQSRFVVFRQVWIQYHLIDIAKCKTIYKGWRAASLTTSGSISLKLRWWDVDLYSDCVGLYYRSKGTARWTAWAP